MRKDEKMRANVLYSVVGVVGGFIAAMFGGWSDALITLIVFMSVDYITGAVIIAFIANECISIIENAGLMGVPVPSVIAKAIDVLRKDSDSVKSEG